METREEEIGFQCAQFIRNSYSLSRVCRVRAWLKRKKIFRKNVQLETTKNTRDPKKTAMSLRG